MHSQDNRLNWAHWLPRVYAGQHDLSLLSRKIIYNVRPDIFELLPFDDDFTFLEPLLFSAFSSPTPSINMESIMVGYFHDNHTPFEFTVKSNNDGVILIPEVGSRVVTKELTHLLSKGPGEIRQIVNAESIDSEYLSFFEDPKYFSGNFSVYKDIHHLLYPLFKFVDGSVGPISKNNLVGIKYLPLLERSLNHISLAYPDYFTALMSVTRGFMVFRQSGMNSFASESAHGIAFLSVPDYVSTPYYIEDIAHQCGHIVFSAIFFRREDLVGVAPDTPISEYNKNPDDNRSIYVVFHAVFTEHVIATCLLSFLESVECHVEEIDEVIGRLAFIMKKYHSDIESLGNVMPRTENGELMYSELYESFRDLYSKCEHIIRTVNLSGQPYNFDFQKYKEVNHCDK